MLRVRLLAFLFLVGLASSASAQNVVCTTRPLGDSSSACASTAFVQNAISGSGAALPFNSVQFNNGGHLGGSANLEWNNSTQVLAVNGTVTLTPPGGTQVAFSVTQTLSGTLSPGQYFANPITLNFGALNVPSVSNGFSIFGFGPKCNYGSTSFLGAATCGYDYVNVTSYGAPGANNDFIVGHLTLCVATANTTDTNAGIFCGNDNAAITGTGWATLVGREIDLNATQAISATKNGLRIAEASTDAFQGGVDDAAIEVIAAGTPVGFKNTILVKPGTCSSGGNILNGLGNITIDCLGDVHTVGTGYFSTTLQVHTATDLNLEVSANPPNVQLAALNDALSAFEDMSIVSNALAVTMVAGPFTINSNFSVTTAGAVTAASYTDPSFTQGSVVFVRASGLLSQDNANLFWDDTNHALGLGTNTPFAVIGSPGFAVDFANVGRSVGFDVINSASPTSSAFFVMITSPTPASTTTDVAFTLVGGFSEGDLFFDTGVTTGFIDVTTLNIDDSNTGDEIMLAKDGSVIFGHGGPALGSVPFTVNLATNVNLVIANNTGVVQLEAINDVLNAFVPVAVAASNFFLNSDASIEMPDTVTGGDEGAGTINVSGGYYINGVALHPGANVNSVSNSDGTLTISPTTGAVVASINLSHANTWLAQQTFNTTTQVHLGTNENILISDNSGVAQIAAINDAFNAFENLDIVANGIAITLISGNLSVSTGLSVNASGQPTLGTAGSVVGVLKFANATSGAVTLQTVTGALGTVTASLPANTGTLAELNLAQTWSAAQAFNNANLVMNGSSSGTTTLEATAAAGSTIATFPANTGTVGELNLAQTWSAVQTHSANIINSAHYLANGTAPTLGTCGTSPSIAGSDVAGKITVGSGTVTSCAITFHTTWGAAPACTANSGTAIASQTVTTTTSTMTIGGTSLTSDVISYHCFSTSWLMPPANDNVRFASGEMEHAA